MTMKPNNISTNLNNSKISIKPNEFNNMDINRIREFIEILEEHQLKCENEKKFVDAEIAKQKVNQLKQVEKDKIISDIKQVHEEEYINYDISKKQAFDEFNQEWNENYNELLSKFKEFEERLKDQQNNELNEKMEEIDKKYIPVNKPTSEILNLEKILNGLIRQKDYIKAHQIQMQINKLSSIDNNIFLIEKEKKMVREIEKIKHKHMQEFNVLIAKRNIAEAEFKKNRKIEFDKLTQGFKNRQKELEVHQSSELSQVINPKKYLARHLTGKSRLNTSNYRPYSSASVEKSRISNK